MEKEIPAVGKTIYYNISMSGLNSWSLRTGVITKISPTGMITLDNGMKFHSNGHQMKTMDHRYPSCRIISTENAKKVIEDDEKRASEIKLVDDILNFFTGRRCMGGCYNLTDGEISAMKEFLNDVCPDKKW